MSIIPRFQYLLVLPNGNIKGYDDLESAKGYINVYYMERVKNSNLKNEYNDITDVSEQFFDTICQNIGAVEGECKVYDNMKIIEYIQENGVFDEEKEELISKLLSYDIKLNIYDYAIDNIFNEVEPIDMMEPYGETFR